MDLAKFFLYSALAVVTYLLLLQWNEDYPPQIAVAPTANSSNTNQDTPTTANVTPDIATDVPVNTPIPESPTSSADTTPPALDVTPSVQLSPGQLVTVTTDTQELLIDMNGGDIVQLALPQYLRQIDVPDDPFILLENSTNRSYVAQSGLIVSNGNNDSGRIQYQPTQPDYQLEPGQDNLTVELISSQQSGVQIIKRFALQRGSYVIDVSYEIRNSTSAPYQARYFGQIKRDAYPDPSDAGGFSRTFLGFATTSTDDAYIKTDFDDIDDGTSSFEMSGGWIAFSQHYFLSAWIPDQTQTYTYETRKNNSNQYFGSFISAPFSLAPGESSSSSIRFYAGPTDQNQLAELAPNLDLTIDYGWLGFLAKPIYWLLTHIEPFVGNYGLAIIILTFLVKAAFYKLSETQYKSMAGMRRIMPKMQQLKESYSDDKVKLQKATMELYKKEKINPFGGCLPMLVQMPVFIALYWMLMRSVELRHAPFFLWIDDLSAMDPFFVLPLLMGASMFLQMSLSPTPGDPMQAKVMKFMPIMMTVFFLWFPAGLVLYWLVNSLLGIAQQWYITRKIEARDAAAKT